MSDLPSAKRKKNNRQIEEEYPILKQDDFKTSIHNIADLPDYLERINQNILNIDKRISKKEINTDKVKEFAKKCEANKNKKESLTDIKNLVKQSVEGINDIFKSQQPQTPEPQPQKLPLQQIQFNNQAQHQQQQQHVKMTSNKNIQSSVIKTANDKNDKEPVHHQKNSKKTVGSNVNNDINEVKKSFKIDITKYNTNGCPNEIYDKKRVINKNSNTLGNKPNTNANTTANTKKQLINNDSTPNKCIINQPIQGRKHSKSPAPKKNSFPFKPKTKKGANTNNNNNDDISEDKEGNISSRNIFDVEEHKEQPSSSIKASLIAQKPKKQQQQMYTSPNNNSSIKKNKSEVTELENSLNPKKSPPIQQLQKEKENMNNSMPKQATKSPNYYTKGMPKDATIQDALRLMLFFNEYIISQHVIKDYKNHHETLNKYSLMISELLNETLITNTNTNSLGISEKDNQQAINAIKIQRQWRLYKFTTVLPPKSNPHEVIKTMVVNDYIDKEGFGARKLIGMLNESLHSFTQMKSKDSFITEIIDLNLNKTPQNTLSSYHKDYYNKHSNQNNQK